MPAAQDISTVEAGRRYTFVVVDMLNDFFEANDSLSRQRGPLVARINELGGVFRSQGQRVIWVRQEFSPDLKDAFLEMRRNGIHINIAGTAGCQLLPDLLQSNASIVGLISRE